MTPLIFISYRREDSSAAARWLWDAIRRTFGPDTVFMDVEGIASGEDWENRIRSQVDAATVVIVVIGPHWLRVTDRHGRRRLDRPDDWVRREIASALESRATVIPLLLSDTPLPEAEAVDASLAGLRGKQVAHLRDDSWETDLARLLERLEKLGFVKTTRGAQIRYPTPKVKIRELTGIELDDALRHLPGWAQTPSNFSRTGNSGTDLHKVYEFASFEDAVAFIGTASPYITRVQHHPRWENVWRTVSVWLSTWDIGSRISPLDVELAGHLDEVRLRYPPPRPKPVRPLSDPASVDWPQIER
jgi:pterin-4a-carbinolamine dehydratase